MSFSISQTSLTARSSSAFTSSVRVNKTRTTSSSSRHSSSSSSSIVTKCEGPSAKNLEIMRKFSEQYARSSGTNFCMDKSVTATVIQGTFNHTTIATFSSFFICGPMHFSSRLRSFLNNNQQQREKTTVLFFRMVTRVLSRMKRTFARESIASTMYMYACVVWYDPFLHPTDFLSFFFSLRPF